MSNHGFGRNKTSTSHDTGYGIFWDEYRSIEQSAPSLRSSQTDIEDGSFRKEDKNESEIQWLNDVGFTNIAKKIRARTEIDRNDDDMKIIAASLTRAQANAVRKRIDSLNEAIRHRKAEEEKQKHFQKNKGKRKDVRNFFESSPPHVHGIQTGAAVESSHKEKTSQNTIKNDIKRHANSLSQDSSKQTDYISSSTRHSSKDSVVASIDGQTQNSSVHSLIKGSTGSPNVSPTFKRIQSPPPQIDNLVKRTSGSHLIVMSGEERELSLKHNPTNTSASVVRRNTDAGVRTITINQTDQRRKSAGVSYNTERGHHKTNSSDGLVNTYRVQGGAVVDAPMKHLLSGGEKRLVIVDSKYINISSVGEMYNHRSANNEVRRSATYNHADVYNNTRQIRMPVNQNKPTSDYSSNEKDSNKVSIATKISSKRDSERTQERKSPREYENQSDLQNIRHNNISQHHSRPREHQNKTQSQDPFDVQMKPHKVSLPCAPKDVFSNTSKPRSSRELVSNSTKQETSNKPMSRDKHEEMFLKDDKISRRNTFEKPKVTIYDDSPDHSVKNNEIVPKNDIKLSKTNISPLPIQKNNSLPIASSDDNKSFSSDDLQQLSPTSDTSFDSTIYNKETIEIEAKTVNKSASKESIHSRGDSPAVGLDGDAKLDVGSPRDSMSRDSVNELVSGPTFPALPNFSLTREELGMTNVGDLSEDDMTKVKSLALLELTALFDACAIPMNRRKPQAKQKFKDTGVFGVPLTTICHREHRKTNSIKPPRIFQEMLKYLEANGLDEEGILRIPGATARVKSFREDCDKNKPEAVSFEGKKINDISTCLKQFLRDLPIPLLSYEYQNTFTSVANLPDRKVQLQALNLLVLLLHPVHQETLRVLLIFLNKIVSHESKNKMGLNNVAMIMAPNLFFQNTTKISIDEASKAAGMTDVLRMLIKYQPILWTIPSFMVGQIRYLYEAGAKTKDPKAVRKIIAKRLKTEGPLTVPRGKSSGSSGDELEEFEENYIIRVKAPSLNKQSMAIQLSDVTTAADVVAKFQWRRQNSQKEKDEIDTSRLSINRNSKKKDPNMEFYLCETGGNIGERRLGPTTSLVAVLKVNPNCEWVLKGRVKMAEET